MECRLNAWADAVGIAFTDPGEKTNKDRCRFPHGSDVLRCKTLWKMHMADQPHPRLALRPPGGRLGMTATVLLVLLLLAGAARGQAPQPGAFPLEPGNRLHISATDRCPVCAMRPFKYPRFASAIQIQDGTTFYFCSAGCMLKAWLRPDVFLQAAPEALKTPVAQDYFTGQPVDARTVHWIAGSDVIGPMGPALVPLQQSTHVDAFRRRHGLTHLFRLEALNADNWETLTGKPFHF